MTVAADLADPKINHALIEEIETSLERLQPKSWLRLSSNDLDAITEKNFAMGWRIDIPLGSLKFAAIDYLVLVIDNWFPNSQARIFAPAAGNDYRWPHIEQEGLLCLRPTRCAATVHSRVEMILNDASELLNYTESKIRDEFEREFSAYWSQRANNMSDTRILSLLTPRGEAREISYFYHNKSKRFIVCDQSERLTRWLNNVGIQPHKNGINPTRLFKLAHPWLPNEFPKNSLDIANLFPKEMILKYFIPASEPRLPIIFEAMTPTGPVFVGAVIHRIKRNKLLKGFRDASRLPTGRIFNAYSNRDIVRCKVSRVDGEWIHGRDHPSSHSLIKNRKIMIVGCGSIGSHLAHTLAQAGVGEIILVDGDTLHTSNISRHFLGLQYTGRNKADGLHETLQKQFPHLTIKAAPTRFEQLGDMSLDILSDVDMIIAAGIDYDGESALDQWRTSLRQPPAYLSTWVEPYAIAGHAILLYGSNSILEAFDDKERPVFRLTDWPDGAGTLIVEAGCGNSFQPHGIVDLQPTISLAAGMAIDVLLDKVPASCRRVWMGDRSSVEDRGGTILGSFTDNMTIREYSWS